MWGLLLGVSVMAFLVLAVGVWQGRLGERVRRDLDGAETLYREEDARAFLGHRAKLAASSQVMTGEVLVAERAVVFFRRSAVLNRQPIVLVRDDRTAGFDAVGMLRLVLAGPPGRGRTPFENAPAIVVRGVQRGVEFTLTIRSSDPERLLAALERFAD